MAGAVLARPRWRDARMLRALHLILAAEHRGIAPRLDQDRLARALEGPHAMIQAGGADPIRLAAAYAAGIADARVIRRGGGALALAAFAVVLRLGGYGIEAEETETAAVFAALEAGAIGAAEIEAWARAKAVRL